MGRPEFWMESRGVGQRARGQLGGPAELGFQVGLADGRHPSLPGKRQLPVTVAPVTGTTALGRESDPREAERRAWD